MKSIYLVVLFVLSLLVPAAKAQDFTLTIYSAAAMESESVFGHVFMCISTNLSGGSKEDCYGFYKRGTAKKEWFIGGTDLVNEFKRQPIRFPSVSASYVVPITLAQRNQIHQTMGTWKVDDYNLFSKNCIDFVDSVLALVGAERPSRSSTQTPTQYVSTLRTLLGNCDNPRFTTSDPRAISRAGSNNVFDIFQSNTSDGTPIILYPRHGGANQLWQFRHEDNGFYSISSRLSGKLVTLSGNRLVQQTRVPGSKSQLWCLSASRPGTIRVKGVGAVSPMYLIPPQSNSQIKASNDSSRYWSN